MSLQLSAGSSGALYDASQVTAVPAASLGRRARILLVEDHPVYSAGLQALFEGDEGFEVVGQVADGEAAVPLVRRCQPDVIILDIGLGSTNGLDLINRFRRINSEVRIAVLTAHEEREHLLTALRLGVQAFIQKDLPGSAILSTVRRVLNGERVVTQPSALTTALTEFGHLLQEHEREHSMLTAQELEILRLAAAGLKNKDIGAHLFLSEVTIKRKLQDIYRKLNVSGKAAAVAEAMRLGWI